MSEHILMSFSKGIATIKFNRPEKRNAITEEMWLTLQRYVEQADELNDVGIIVITGAGGNFIAGADLSEYETIHTSTESTIRYLNIVSRAFAALATAKKATVAKIEGACIGGGCLIACACDLRYATDNSRYCFPPSMIGLIFPLSDTKRLIDLLGPAVAKELIFSARVFYAPEAFQFGMLNAIFSADEFEAGVEDRLRGILANSPSSVITMKKIFGKILDGRTNDDSETQQWLRDALRSADYLEGQAAFKEKRSPRFRFS